MKKKALVMEIKQKQMILMTEEGRFLSRNITSPVPQIGEEVLIDCKERKHFSVPISLLALAAVLALVFFAGRIWQQQNAPVTMTGTAVSFIFIDINPSVELGVDKDNMVVSAEGLNEDGKKILQKKNLIGKRSADAVEEIVMSAADCGYLAPEKDNQIIINISGTETNSDKNAALDSELLESAKKVVAERKLETKVECFNTGLEVREEAKELGISPSKYVLLVEAQEAGLDINPETIKDKGIVRSVKDAGGNPGELISKVAQEKEINKKIIKWKKDKQNAADNDKKEKNNAVEKNDKQNSGENKTNVSQTVEEQEITNEQREQEIETKEEQPEQLRERNIEIRKRRSNIDSNDFTRGRE